MTVRLFAGQRPGTTDVGFWIANPGYDCLTSDRTSRAAFRFSSSFTNRKPMRLIGAGIKTTNQAMPLPNSLANLGGTPILTYRAMSDATKERQINYIGVENDGSGNSYAGTELYNRLVDGNPAYFTVNIQGNPTSTAVMVRYMIFLV